jgi:quinol monooxygenase YgiN
MHPVVGAVQSTIGAAAICLLTGRQLYWAMVVRGVGAVGRRQGLIIVTGYIQVAAENRKPALVAARMLIAHSRKEVGNACYDFCEDIDIPGKFRFYEEWQSPMALAGHLRANYTLQFRQAISALGVLSINVKRLDDESSNVGDPAANG